MFIRVVLIFGFPIFFMALRKTIPIQEKKISVKLQSDRIRSVPLISARFLNFIIKQNNRFSLNVFQV